MRYGLTDHDVSVGALQRECTVLVSLQNNVGGAIPAKPSEQTISYLIRWILYGMTCKQRRKPRDMATLVTAKNLVPVADINLRGFPGGKSRKAQQNSEIEQEIRMRGLETANVTTRKILQKTDHD